MAHLIEDFLKKGLDFKKALEEALKKIEGTYGLAAISQTEPKMLFVARKGSPLIIGIGKGEVFVASDAAALVNYTRKVIYLDDGEIGQIGPDKVEISQIAKAK